MKKPQTLSTHPADSAIKRSLEHNDLKDYSPDPLLTTQRVELWGFIEWNNGNIYFVHPVCGMQIKFSDVLCEQKIKTGDG